MDDVVMSSNAKELENSPKSSLFDSHQYLFDVVLYIDDVHYVFNIIFALVGIPINLLIMGVIVLFKRFHLPRNFIWLGIGMSNVLILASHLLIVQSILWGSSLSTRALHIWFVVLSDAVQTWNVFFAVLERHVCIHYPKWHKILFTTTSITVAQLSSFVILFLVFGITQLQIFQDIFMSGVFSSWHFKLIGSIIFGFLPFCLVGQAAIMRTTCHRNVPSIETDNDHVIQPKTSNTNFILIGNNLISRLDFDAAQSFYFLVKMHLILMVIILIPFVLIFICLQQVSEQECSPFIQGFYYTSNLLDCLHSSIANPVAFVLLSRDFLSALESRRRRTSNRVHQQVPDGQDDTAL